MMLEFAENQNAEPVHISRVRPDQNQPLFCPHCAQRLVTHTRATEHWLAAPYFGHTGPICQYCEAYDQEEHIRIPLYREFERYPDPQIVTGSLPLPELYKLQQDAMRYVYSVFYDEHQHVTAPSAYPSYRQTDRKLFEWTFGKCLLFTLYLVEIQLAHTTIYHIGSSDQSEAAYLSNLPQEFPPVDIIYDLRVRLALPKMAALEYYFQHRFRAHEYPFPNGLMLPDFFAFAPDTLEQALAELRRLPYVTNTRREKILMGMLKARMDGKQIGRPPESPERFLRKKKSQQIAALLAKGRTVQEIRHRSGATLKTIRKVQGFLEQQRATTLPDSELR